MEDINQKIWMNERGLKRYWRKNEDSKDTNERTKTQNIWMKERRF